MNIYSFISNEITSALISIGAPKDCDAALIRLTKKKYDYQANGIMNAAKKMKITPQVLAKKIANKLDFKNITSKIEITDPGFINILLNPIWIAEQAEKALKNKHLSITKVHQKIIVIDYSSPNIAKQMHVGHLRSTIIGDAVARTLEFIGHKVIRANHIGDWGTQFGMLIAYLEDLENKEIKDILLTNLEKFYREAKEKYDKDENFAIRSRIYVVKLQSGDKYCRKIWSKLVYITMQQNQKIYNRLNITLTENDIMGESLYNNMLKEIVSDLKNKGIAVENNGAVVVFLDEFKNKKGEVMGVIIQKNDGAFLYTTTDIACAKYRYEVLHADRSLYYIDSRQSQHLKQAWAIARKANYVSNSMTLEHHMFGMVLGKNGKPFKTRSGNTIFLSDLLDEAINRAKNIINKKKPNIKKTDLLHLANVIGIGAIKYADLSKNRITDYTFDWDKMLSFEGNTAPYLQYAYTRITSIFKKANIIKSDLILPILLYSQYEISLATRLIQFEETIFIVAQEGIPHIMCSYLYDIAVLFSKFYENCPVLSVNNKEQKQSRLKLALLTQKTLKTGLNLLGIETIEKM
ncbi:Arginine--tRNA ligase [Candidatus Providencia siddallii]|uniref:Arginine--tRNA ligase n=1 Tax=Candidatus Providencia siddallii TaxID=1715285 RepID=A0A0M6W9K1_9GAMM|nr:Arginine--tRNA ligase [Candidatus Providencia siddallii]